MTYPIPLVLASASPRRQQLIKMIDPLAIIAPSDANESITEEIEPMDQPTYLAVRKGKVIHSKYPEAIVLGCDTSVFYGDEILGKPKDSDDAKHMLRLLSGNQHTVVTGCALFYKEVLHTFSVHTIVRFYDLSDEEIESYIATGEPMDKAGAYGIQGKGMFLVKEIQGDYSNVVGLPVAQLKRELNMFFKTKV